MPGATSTPCRGWASRARCGAAPGPGRRPYTLPCATWRGRASTAPPVARHGRVVARGSLVRARAYARPREPRGRNGAAGAGRGRSATASLPRGRALVRTAGGDLLKLPAATGREDARLPQRRLADEHGLARRASRGVFGPEPPPRRRPRGTSPGPPGSSPPSPATPVAPGTAGPRRRTGPAACASCATATGCPTRIAGGFVGAGGPPHGGHGVGHRGPPRRGLCAPRAPRSQRRPDARVRRQDVGRAQRRGPLDAALLGQVPGG